jgi:RimJ/RimL family protein N-acetyltransferase
LSKREDGYAIGYRLEESFRGRGYATETVGSLVAFAFEKLGARKVVSAWAGGNLSSGRVLEKLGFTETPMRRQPVRGVLEKLGLAKGAAAFAHRMELTREVFMTRRRTRALGLRSTESLLLETERLILRPPSEADIPALVPLIGDFDVSKNLSRVPHPYTEEDARGWIAKTVEDLVNGTDYPFAILRKEDGAYVGTCGLHPARGWEFGYWIGKPYWGRGYATEAARRAIVFGFEKLGAECLNAKWFCDNPASGHVLEKLGCVADGEEMSNCLSRGVQVFCHKVVLTRNQYEQQKEFR